MTICRFCVRASSSFSYAQAPDQDGAAAEGGGERAGEIINSSTATGQARKAAPVNVRGRPARRFIYVSIGLYVRPISLILFLPGPRLTDNRSGGLSTTTPSAPRSRNGAGTRQRPNKSKQPDSRSTSHGTIQHSTWLTGGFASLSAWRLLL